MLYEDIPNADPAKRTLYAVLTFTTNTDHLSEFTTHGYYQTLREAKEKFQKVVAFAKAEDMADDVDEPILFYSQCEFVYRDAGNDGDEVHVRIVSIG